MTPSQLKTMSFEQASKICRDYAIAGIETIANLPRNGVRKPLRFIYISGSNAVRPPAQKPWILGDYSVMRVRLRSSLRFAFSPFQVMKHCTKFVMFCTGRHRVASSRICTAVERRSGSQRCQARPHRCPGQDGPVDEYCTDHRTVVYRPT